MPYKILLIEDNEGDIFLIKEAFKETNFQGDITEIKDGDAAIDYFLKKKANDEDFSIDLVLLDVNLPKRNGHEVLKFIKSTPYLKHIPVVVFTTSSAKSDIQKAYKNAANSFITKPIDSEGFQEVIARIQNYWFSVTQLP
ncbi:response regulator [Flavobacterium sp. 102]|uniref:response regulator n=1 Tax=Flavobacterium sp. 102 TaxID=2135623 RepID=UPI000EAB6ACB|nr:response regulator [Flavobacterium sp. 102]RKS03157.1 CheY-like chemotaxis protein [Flavobacterium sp. 102]